MVSRFSLPVHFILPLAVIVGLLPCSAQAAARVGAIEVRDGHGGMPCFTVSEQEERRSGTPDFRAIVVTDGASVMWKMGMPKSRSFSMSYHMCIPYAGRLPVLPQTPAASLHAGKAYDVTVTVDAPRNATAPRLYRGRFCVNGKEGAWKTISDSNLCAGRKSVR